MRPEERKPIAVTLAAFCLWALLTAAIFFIPSCDEPQQVQEPDPPPQMLNPGIPAGGG